MGRWSCFDAVFANQLIISHLAAARMTSDHRHLPHEFVIEVQLLRNSVVNSRSQVGRMWFTCQDVRSLDEMSSVIKVCLLT